MHKLRMPFFVAAVLCMVAVVLIEIGSGFILQNGLGAVNNVKGAVRGALPADADGPLAPILESIEETLGEADDSDLSSAADEDIPGYGIPYMAVLDGVLLFTMLVSATSTFMPKKWHSRLQGCVSCGVSCLGILGTIGMIFVAIGLLILMVALLLAVPFGTIAYMVIYGFFNTSGANLVLGVLLTLKIAFLVLMILAHQHYMRNCSFLLMTFSSILANLLLSILYSFVPGFLVSIADMLGAIIIAICGCIWLVLLLLSALSAIFNAVKNLPAGL